uniref:NADH-ubiquinone oxidoreductase chain 4L n=1 Tax=Kulikovia alborostrata TaxID=187796 RepID=I6MR69_9BILA|nr:NADH dehydrogenase subunit 4L [Kulikovia alborostrata]AEM23547.1 NADH dehydrogenase subunit 4L [Kulikovia alborostrata]
MFVETNLSFSFLSIMLIFSAYVGLLMERGHLLMVLLLFEVSMLGLFFYIFSSVYSSFSSFYLCLVLISFAACEAAVGLALLVCFIRSHGNDFVSSLSIYEC